MEVKETARGKIFITKNKFSRNMVNKNNRKLTNFIKLKYSIVKKFHLQKAVKKRAWFRTLDDFLCDEVPDYQKEHMKNHIILSDNDLHLESLVIYDLIPKEYLDDYKEKYLKFRQKYRHESFFDGRVVDVQRSFERMMNSGVVGSWHNVDHFGFTPKCKIAKLFSSIRLEMIGLTESFYIVKYTLTPQETVNRNFSEILSSIVHKDPMCISGGKWWKRKSFSGCALFDSFEEAKNWAINEFILELKSHFFKIVKNELMTKFYNWYVIPPSVAAYSSQTICKNSDNILNVMASNGDLIETSESKDIYFILSRQNMHQNVRFNNSALILAQDYFKDKNRNGLIGFLEYDELICTYFADYFVLDSLSSVSSKTIYDCQLKINKNVYSRSQFNSLIKMKLRIDKSTYFYRRLFKELPEYNQDNMRSEMASFNSHFKRSTNDFIVFNSFEKAYVHLYYSAKDKNSLLDKIYLHFEENSKLTESRYNYRIVKWTCIIAALTLIVTILLANNCEIINKILVFLKSLFTR